MPPVRDTPRLQGMRLRVADAGAAAALLGRLLDEPPPRDGACVRLGTAWLAFDDDAASGPGTVDATPPAPLQWGSHDLARQRTLLAQLGIDLLDDTSPNDGSLRIAAADTGACALAWRALQAAPDDANADAPAGPLLRVVVMATRTPERTASHWAQMFRTPVVRDATGAPLLLLDGVSLRFVFSDGPAGGVVSLTLGLPDPAAASLRADALGLPQLAGDAVSLAGVALRLVQA